MLSSVPLEGPLVLFVLDVSLACSRTCSTRTSPCLADATSARGGQQASRCWPTGCTGSWTTARAKRSTSHPGVTGELALGHLSRRSEILRLLHNLPQATVATDVEVLTLIDSQHLFGRGIGYVDSHLLAATMLTTDARLWTRDKRLSAVAAQHGLAGGDAKGP